MEVEEALGDGPREILARIGRELATCGERITYRTGGFDWSANVWQRRLCCWVSDPPAPADLAAWWQLHMRERAEPPLLLNAASLAEAAELYRRLFSARLTELREKADQVCRGEFSSWE